MEETKHLEQGEIMDVTQEMPKISRIPDCMKFNPSYSLWEHQLDQYLIENNEKIEDSVKWMATLEPKNPKYCKYRSYKIKDNDEWICTGTSFNMKYDMLKENQQTGVLFKPTAYKCRICYRKLNAEHQWVAYAKPYDDWKNTDVSVNGYKTCAYHFFLKGSFDGDAIKSQQEKKRVNYDFCDSEYGYEVPIHATPADQIQN